jgi:hypothetical protein
LGAVLSGNCQKFVSLAALWDLDSVLVGPLLDFCSQIVNIGGGELLAKGNSYVNQTKSQATCHSMFE